MNAYPDWLSLREIDQAAGAVKGSAFRAFKAIEAQLDEGLDYRILDAIDDRADVAKLRAAGRVYDSSVRILLLSPATAARVAAALAASGRD